MIVYDIVLDKPCSREEMKRRIESAKRRLATGVYTCIPRCGHQRTRLNWIDQQRVCMDCGAFLPPCRGPK